MSLAELCSQDLDRLRLEAQNLGPFLVIKYIKNYSYQNMSITKVVTLFLYFSTTTKKIQKDPAYF